MIELTRLWENTKKDGEVYFSGSLGKARIVIFKNKFKEEGSNEPDYVLYLDEQQKRETPKPVIVNDEDVPF